MKCQLPPCNLENHRDFIYVMINKATNATRCVATKLKNLLEGNVDATKCTALHHGKIYTILRRMRETGGHAQWDFCICQYKQQCYDKEWIKDYLEPGIEKERQLKKFRRKREIECNQ
uniref:Uncharacterized protein n=1 Tax=Romanomermis culicivorax TaxID=13658 RepID=A0A915KU42_ROMCU